LLIDTHAHLDMEQFKDDLTETLGRADDAGVAFIITIGADIGSSRAAARLAGQYERVYFSPGFHPHDVKDVREEDYSELRALAADPKAVAIGETGLDYHYDLSPRDTQRTHFARQIALAGELGKPVIVHSREAESDTMEILASEGLPARGGTMHCFAGGYETARRALDMGMFLSVGGTLTFKKADSLRDVIRKVPIERLLLETDCPYLAPHPMRGRRNEPAYVGRVAETLAELKGLSVEDVGRITSMNAMALFNIGDLPREGAIAYPIRGSLYLNITNQCTNACLFCVRNTTDFVKGHNLRLARDPSAQEVIEALGGFEKYREVVFCGYGEPFMRLDVLKQAAAHVKKKGVRVRVNTNGHALLIHGRDILPEIAGLVDSLSVSLNFPTPGQYADICRPSIGEGAYEAVKQFVIMARKIIPEVTVTVLDMPGVDLAACRKVAREELGVPLRVREYNDVG
jgi:TatD DNase family protein